MLLSLHSSGNLSARFLYACKSSRLRVRSTRLSIISLIQLNSSAVHSFWRNEIVASTSSPSISISSFQHFSIPNDHSSQHSAAILLLSRIISLNFPFFIFFYHLSCVSPANIVRTFPGCRLICLRLGTKKTCIRKAISAKRCRFVGCEPSSKSEKSFYSLSLLLIIRFSTSFATGPADAYPVPPFLIHTTKANG